MEAKMTEMVEELGKKMCKARLGAGAETVVGGMAERQGSRSGMQGVGSAIQAVCRGRIAIQFMVLVMIVMSVGNGVDEELMSRKR
jgi:hypothetical protein